MGESERTVRALLTHAAASTPCIIFFDEVDALAFRRGRDTSNSSVTERIVNQPLTEMDGLSERKDLPYWRYESTGCE